MAVVEKSAGGGATMTRQDKERIFALFGRYINKNQIKYLSAGHLDVFETRREGVGFTDPVTGRRMYDCFTAAGCFNVSRHNPEVMAALAGRRTNWTWEVACCRRRRRRPWPNA